MDKPAVLQIGPYPAWDDERLCARFDMRKLFEAADRDAFLDANAPAIRAIATRGDLGASGALIERLPALEIVSVYGVGYDGVDLGAARERGVRVTNTPDVLTGDVADFGIAMMLAARRGIIGGEAWARGGRWASDGMFALQRRVHGARVGVLGLGRIGFEVARRLEGFDVEIAYSDLEAKPHARPGWTFVPDVVALAERCEILFVTLAASEATRHIVGAQAIAALGPDGLLVNISRASNIDEEALIAALSSGALGAAALDVFDGEPAFDRRFLDLPNVLLQPHQASGTVETRKAMGKLVFDNLAAHFDGAPLPTPVL